MWVTTNGGNKGSWYVTCVASVEPTHLILFLLLQRLADPFQSLFVRQPGPLLPQTVFNVFGCGLEIMISYCLFIY